MSDIPKNPSGEQIEKIIVESGKTAPRITPEGIEAAIVKEEYQVFAGSTLTVCVLTLKNGFTVTGESACASPENFNKELGEAIARKAAVQKIWPLMGYSLREQLAKAAEAGEATDHVGRLKQEVLDVEAKLLKLNLFMQGNVQFDRLSTEERSDMLEQAVSMTEYLGTLRRRLARVA